LETEKFREAFEKSCLRGFRPDPKLSVTQWADRYRILPKKSSSEPGRYRSSRTPYVREIMDCLSPTSPVAEICVMKGTQLGFTEVANNWFGFIVDITPGPMLMVFPTGDLARDHSKQKMQPTINDTPRLKDKIREARSRDSGNTIETKEFPGGILFMSGSNSGAFFRSKSIRYLFLDDVDGFDVDVGGEGDPAELARKRTDTYGKRKKIFEVSTPTIKGISRIERSFTMSDQRYYHVPCPLCGEFQRLVWGGEGADFGIKFDRDAEGTPILAWYECKYCHGRIDEHHKPAMLERGKWIPTRPDRQKRGYQISSLYSPLGWVSWLQIVKEFLEAKCFKERLKAWCNTRLGETFEEIGEQPEWSLIKARSEAYEILTIPMGGLLLTSGVDVQDNRLAVVIRAWGRGEESWLIYWGEIYGDPAQAQVWANLESLLSRPFQHATGQELHIVCAAIDSGGHHTNAVYAFARRNPRYIAIKGMSQPGKPIIGHPSTVDMTWRGEKIPGGCQLWPVGADTAKSTIYARLKITEPGPGFYHFPIGVEDAYFIQLTAEKLITRYVKGFPKMEWTLAGPRNEALDCEVYSYAAAIRAGMVHFDWAALENAIRGIPPAETAAPARRTTNPREQAPSRW
jgi:phage terminase large subunit GpA-like protein